MSYQVELKRRASKALDDIPAQDWTRILAAVQRLSVQPRPPGARKLSGREGWRIRSQGYRVIDEIDDVSKKVFVLVIGHRKDIYCS